MLWVAEVGSAHKGIPSLAFEYIRAFSEAGANVLKFQFGWTKEAQEEQGLEYKAERFVDEWSQDLLRWCNYYNVELMASIWSIEGFETAKSVDLPQWKVGYRMRDRKLVSQICEYTRMNHKMLWLSGFNVHCISKYPVYPEELKLPDRFDDQIFGYSDHSHGIEACLLAVARGATYVEKHVALDKTDLVVKDTPFSATPEEFAEMVRIGNGIRRLVNAGV